MASSVAKLKPLQYLSKKPDEVVRKNMKENDVLAGLAKAANSDRKAALLAQLRANARRNGGRLKFGDRHGLFQVLKNILSDNNENTRLQCLEFLSETIPQFGEDLDSCMSLLLPQVVSNLGNNQSSVRKSAIQTLHVYMQFSKDFGNIFSTIIEHGLESDDRRTRNESLIAMPILITPNLAQEDLFIVTQALVGRLETSSKPESSPAIISLDRIRNNVGSVMFESYLRRLTQAQQKVYSTAVQNRTPDSGRDFEGFMARKAKSAGHLNANGIMELERRFESSDGGSSFDRANTIAINNSRVGSENEGNVEFGFVPQSVIEKLKDQTNWRVRAQGIEELKTLLGQVTNVSSILPFIGSLFGLLMEFLDDVNFKITVTSLQIIELLVGKLESSVKPVKPFLKPLVSALANKLGDNKIVIRQENMKVLLNLMHILSPTPILKVLISSFQHKNSRVREEAVNVVIAALLTFPSSDFDLPELTSKIAPSLVDSKRRVRQAALEAFAVIAQAMGPGRLQPVVKAVDNIELTMGGEGVMAAIQARLARRQLPRMNSDGLVEYAVPCPSSGIARGKSTTPRGADVEWILAGTSSDPSSARSTPGLNDSFSSSGPSPRRYFSAGKKRLPWEGEDSPAVDGTEKPFPTKNSWVPTELINDGKRGTVSRQLGSSLSSTVAGNAPISPTKPAASYAEKYLAKSLHSSSQSADNQVAKGLQDNTSSPPMNSYVEIHRKKKEKKITNFSGTATSTSFAGVGAGNSYALLYKHGTIHSNAKDESNAKASSSAEPEASPKEPIVRGTQSATPPSYLYHPASSDDEYSNKLMKKSYNMTNSLSSSWPDWTEPTSSGRPFGRLSPVSHDAREIQTPVHIKPQLVRSASKVRTPRAPELELDMSSLNNRPAPLAPVGQAKTGGTVPPPKDALQQVRKQAATKRALKMYSVMSDSDDGKSRTPSPPELTPVAEQAVRSSIAVLNENSPFDSRPRIARTPLQGQKPSKETSSVKATAQGRLDPLSLSLGVTGYGILPEKSQVGQNGLEIDQENQTTVNGNNVNGSIDMKNVEVVGQGFFKAGKQQVEESDQFEYETEDSEDEDEDEDDDDEDEGDDDDDDEEEDITFDYENDETDNDELLTSDSETPKPEIVEKSERNNLKEVRDEENLIPVDNVGVSSESEEETLADKQRGRDMTPRTMRKSLSKSTRERMERRRQEEEDKILKEQQRLEELEKERMRQRELQQENENRLKNKIKKEQEELEKMLLQKEKEREMDKQKQKLLQLELQQQEKALKEKLQKQTEELEVFEQEKLKEREREKERLKEKAKQRQLKLQRESELKMQKEAEMKLQNEAELKKQKEAELKMQREAELKMQREAELKMQREADLKKQREAELKKQREAELKKQREAELKKQREAELKAQLEEEKNEEIKRAELEALRQQQLKKEVERKRRELEKQRLASAREMEAVKDLTVTGSNSSFSPVKQPTSKPPSGSSPRKKMHTSSANSEREAGYALTDESSEERNQYAVSSYAGANQCWEISLDELKPFGNPEQAFRDLFKCFDSSTEDWQVRCEGLQYVRRLCKHHPEVVTSQLHSVVLAVLKEVKNLRSQVSRAAICSLGDMFACLGKNLDMELEAIAKILLPKAGESSGFIRDDVERTLSAMVQSSGVTRCLGALIIGGACHRNVAVRKTTAQFLSVLAERMGPNRLLCGTKDVTERILPCLAKLAVDSGLETRYWARKVLFLIYEHPDFDKQLAKYVSGSDFRSTRDICDQLRIKGLGDPPSDPSSARQRKYMTGSGIGSRTGSGSSVKSRIDSSLRASLSPGSSREPSRSSKTSSRESLRIQGEENIPDLLISLGANEWKERLQAIDHLVNLVRSNPDGLGSKFTKVIDVYIQRLQDPNSKVNLRALQSLVSILPALANQSGALVPPLVSALTANLASKNINIYNAASEGMKELIKQLDNVLLIQPFSAASQYGNTRVRPIMTENLSDIVPGVYARKPPVISRHVLPVMWAQLETGSATSAGAGNGNMKSATEKLIRVLYSCMGRSLVDQSSTQKPRVKQKLQELVDGEQL